MEKLRVLLVSIVPPRNDCGVRIVMHRHLVEGNPFKLHVASNADFEYGLLVHTPPATALSDSSTAKEQIRSAIGCVDHGLRKFHLAADRQWSFGRSGATFQTGRSSYSCRMWIVSDRSKNGAAAWFATGRAFSRLVSRDERPLRSPGDAGNLEPTVPRTLRRM